MTHIKDGDDIPDSDHVLRYCSPIHVREGKIKSTAFEIRVDEEYLSVYWLEFFNGDSSPAECLSSARQAIGANLKIKKGGRLAKIHVGAAKAEIDSINIKYKPLPNGGESHAGIFPKRRSRMDLLESRELSVQLKNCVSDIYPAL